MCDDSKFACNFCIKIACFRLSDNILICNYLTYGLLKSFDVTAVTCIVLSPTRKLGGGSAVHVVLLLKIYRQ